MNEAFLESLYPRDFIKVLPQSPEHFGPRQIFGYEGNSTGLDIIRTIPKNSKPEIIDDYKIIVKKIHSGVISSLPESLINAIAWFICCSAIRRYQQIIKPVTMLIHTSQKQSHHEHMAEAIKHWLTETPLSKIESLCEKVYKSETTRFNKEVFKEEFPEYRLVKKITDYPTFSCIKEAIQSIVSDVSHIMMMRETEEITFSRGINLCIDNSSNTGVNDDDEHVRLIYPENESVVDFSTSFIVVGGNTLSRGLTLEGLVCTYFLRNVCQADTLMQMGRWFGYRRGYELLPRIWMTTDTEEKFNFLTTLEEELRADLKDFHEDLRLPKDFGPRVKNSIRTSWLRPTAKNRMQEAISCDVDYSGFNTQTTLFKKSAISKNFSATEEFLATLGNSKRSSDGSSVYYERVSFDLIKKYLRSMEFHDDALVLSDIEPFIKWYEEMSQKAKYADWNVVIGSIKGEGNDKWEKFDVHKVKRTVVYRTSDGGEDIFLDSLRRRECIHMKRGRKPLNFT